MSAPRLPAGTAMGAVHLTVADLERSLDYYRRAIGLDVLESGPGRASLGAGGRELLVIVEVPGAGPADGYTGLFHFALLVPSRADLARWLAHASRDRVALTGLSDHDVSEALYLRDPDGYEAKSSSTRGAYAL
ncbi:MAG: VOC family protein [Gaiellaceae bacterium]